jgi:protein-S-isoprenylcysteine O-methyltransferase Ste14
MGDSWRLGTDERELTTLVHSGLYQIVRHPIYIAQGLLLVASLLMLPAPMYLLLAVVHAWCIYEKTSVEERYLRHAHGDAYRMYQERVGRFWPTNQWRVQRQRMAIHREDTKNTKDSRVSS